MRKESRRFGPIKTMCLATILLLLYISPSLEQAYARYPTSDGYDFTIQSITLSSPPYYPGSTLGVTATIKNTGNQLGTVYVDLGIQYPDGTRIYPDQGKIYDIPVGGSSAITLHWGIPSNAPTGTYYVNINVYTPNQQHLFDTSGFSNPFSVQPVSYTVSLTSSTTDGQTNVGTILFDGVTYPLPNSVSKQATSTYSYSAQANPPAGYIFSNWATSGQVLVSNTASQGTGVMVQGAGTLSTVFSPAPTFDITAPSSITVTQGNSATATISMTSRNQFSGSISLSLGWNNGRPSWVSQDNFNPNPVSLTVGASTTSTLTVAVSGSATPGTYSTTVVGTSGSLSEQASVQIVVQQAPPTTGNLQVVVKDQSGNPISGTTVATTSVPSGQPQLSGTTDATGQHTWASVLTGSYTLQASANGYNTNSNSGTVYSGQTDTITITLTSSQPTISAPQLQNQGISSADSSVPQTPPVTATLGGQFRLWYWIYNPNSVSIQVILGASITIVGNQPVSDPANDRACTLAAQTTTICNRNFNIPSNIPAGTYDVIYGVWNSDMSKQYVQTTESGWLVISTLYTVTLTSSADDGSTNIGSITFAGTTYPLPTSIKVASGPGYGVSAQAPTGYVFDRWTYSGGISLLDLGGGTASVTVSRDGQITALFKHPPFFDLSSSQPSLSVSPGNSVTTTISVISRNGFAGSVGLQLGWRSDLNVASYNFDVNPVTVSSGGTAQSRLTVTIASGAPPGTYYITVTGTSGSLSQSIQIPFTVTAPIPALVVFPVQPSDSALLTSLPITLQVQVTTGSSTSPVKGAQVTFSLDGSNAGSAFSDSSGYASTVIYSLSTGKHNWAASASLSGYQSGGSPVRYFTYQPPTLQAYASANVTTGIAPLAVQFSGSATGGSTPYTWYWNLGDGSYTTGSGTTFQYTTHTYTSAGNYTVQLTVTDSAGTKASANSIIISVRPPSTLSINPVSPASGSQITKSPVILEVRVMSGNSAVQGASVSFYLDSALAGFATTDSQGYASVAIQASLPTGVHHWYVIVSGLPVSYLSDTWTFDYEPIGSLQVLVRDQSGNAIPGASVTSITQPSGQSQLSGTTDNNGQYTWTSVSTGPYTLQASKSGYETNSGTVIIYPGQTATVTITLSLSAKLDGLASNLTLSSAQVQSGGNVQVVGKVTNTGTVYADYNLYIDASSICGYVDQQISIYPGDSATISLTCSVASGTPPSAYAITVWFEMAKHGGSWQNLQKVGVLSVTVLAASLVVNLASPPNGATITSLPVTLTARVVSGSSPIQDASVSFHLETSPVGSAQTNSSGYASSRVQASLTTGLHCWYASASKAGYQDADSDKWCFNYQPIAQQPDLTISGITTDKGTYKSGETVIVTAAVTNQGTAAASSIQGAIYVDGTQVGTDGGYSLSPGQSATRQFKWTATVGTHTIRWVVDPNNAIAESNESNNYRDVTVVVSASPILVVKVTASSSETSSGSSIVIHASVGASDGTNPPVSYSWNTSGGSLNSTSSNSVLWTAPSVASSTTYVISVSVSSAGYVGSSSSIQITVNPSEAGQPHIEVSLSLVPELICSQSSSSVAQTSSCIQKFAYVVGDRVGFKVVVTNNGNAEAESPLLQIYSNATNGNSPVYVNSFPISSLLPFLGSRAIQPGETDEFTFDMTADHSGVVMLTIQASYQDDASNKYSSNETNLPQTHAFGMSHPLRTYAKTAIVVSNSVNSNMVSLLSDWYAATGYTVEMSRASDFYWQWYCFCTPKTIADYNIVMYGDPNDQNDGDYRRLFGDLIGGLSIRQAVILGSARAQSQFGIYLGGGVYISDAPSAMTFKNPQNQNNFVQFAINLSGPVLEKYEEEVMREKDNLLQAAAHGDTYGLSLPLVNSRASLIGEVAKLLPLYPCYSLVSNLAQQGVNSGEILDASFCAVDVATIVAIVVTAGVATPIAVTVEGEVVAREVAEEVMTTEGRQIIRQSLDYLVEKSIPESVLKMGSDSGYDMIKIATRLEQFKNVEGKDKLLDVLRRAGSPSNIKGIGRELQSLERLQSADPSATFELVDGRTDIVKTGSDGIKSAVEVGNHDVDQLIGKASDFKKLNPSINGFVVESYGSNLSAQDIGRLTNALKAMGYNNVEVNRVFEDFM